MIRLIFLTDFTESFAYCLLRGILKYSKQTRQWSRPLFSSEVSPRPET